MAKMNGAFKYQYDAAPESALIPKDHAAHTATFNGTPIVLDVLSGFWTNGELADMAFAVAVNVEAIDATTGDETYTLELEFGPVGFGTSSKTHKAIVKGPGQYAFLVDFDTVVALQANTAAMRIAATLAGTTPSITMHAWIAGRILDA